MRFELLVNAAVALAPHHEVPPGKPTCPSTSLVVAFARTPETIGE